MKKKLTAAALLCIALTILFSVTVFGGWEEQRKWKYRDENGDYKTDQWFTDSSGKTYYLDEEGYLTLFYLSPTKTYLLHKSHLQISCFVYT